MTTEEAKQVLRNAGYYVDNLWSIYDVDTEGIDMTNDERYDILNEVLTSPRIIQEINETIDFELNNL
jgi:glutathione synthase/RimK-type ligase-like ATP-grasp enzyme